MARAVLVIAGSDSGGGAGIQADLAALRDHGVHGCTAITAITAQNTRGVRGVHLLPPEVVVAQIEAVLDDVEVGAIKIGMLGDVGIVTAVADALAAARAPIVLDPVMVSTSGHRLLTEAAIGALRDRLAPLAMVCTPNLPEAWAWVGSDEEEDLLAWVRHTGVPLVVTGGDAEEGEVVDRLIRPSGIRRWVGRRIPGEPFHGTGCTFASALAARVACGEPLDDAVAGAIRYVRRRLEAAIRPGHGAAIGGVVRD
ncbi:MAG TPA: bifunctional hydroxymethylpyrimidine kinase/phosphomethylpyrimidine kinase [Myxococcota bacterium]|nr:bifunctional hydroxymethylpyrimidine kinase/phosphomethylpyrimidine kinase [Myxococcota bacterium]